MADISCVDCGQPMKESRNKAWPNFPPLLEICDACLAAYQDEGNKFRGYRADRVYHSRNEGMNGTNAKGD